MSTCSTNKHLRIVIKNIQVMLTISKLCIKLLILYPFFPQLLKHPLDDVDCWSDRLNMISFRIHTLVLPTAVTNVSLLLYSSGWTQVGAQGSSTVLGPLFYFTSYIHHFCSCLHSKTVGPFQLEIIQPKNLIKIINHSQCWLYFSKKKNYFITKKPCVIGKTKVKCFATTINWYKYQWTVASY